MWKKNYRRGGRELPYLWQLPFHLRECFRVPWRKGPWTGQEYQDSPCVAMRGRGVTVIGDGGATLSGGEKQRISIARAMLKDAPIVILDEATASVDPENEHLIQQAISELTHGKTIIIIAHRLATIKNADQILVVDKGRIAQKGTHQQLINQEGIYKHFISIREQAEGWSID